MGKEIKQQFAKEQICLIDKWKDSDLLIFKGAAMVNKPCIYVYIFYLYM